MGRIATNRIGERHGRLVIVEKALRDRFGHQRFKCLCDCGNFTTVSYCNFSKYTNRVPTSSCGCYKKEVAAQNGRKSSSGSKSPFWKGGTRINVRGYRTVTVPPSIKKGRFVFEHRLIWEKAFGKIPDNHVIHHLNGIKSDNRIENLCCVPVKEHSPRKIVEPYETRIKELELKLKEACATC